MILRATIARGPAVALMVLLTFLAVPVASADADQFEISVDGTTWGGAFSDALFEDDIVLVPGTSASVQLQIRSDAVSAGLLDLALKNVEASDSAAAKSFGFQVDVDETGQSAGSAAGLVRTSLAELGDGAHLDAPLLLEPGETVTLTLTIDLDGQLAENRTQNSTIGLDLALMFTDALGAGDGNSGGDTPGEGASAVNPLGESASGEGRPGEHRTTGEPTGVTGHGAVPQLVVPIIRSGGAESTSRDAGARSEWSMSSAQSGSTFSPGNAGSTREGLRVLAITGSSLRAMILTAALVTALGALLLVMSRRRTQRKS